PALYSTHTFETLDSISGLERYVQPDVLIIFDIGNTLIEGGTCWGHSRSIVTAIDDAEARGEDTEEFLKTFAPEWIFAQKFCPGQLVEPETKRVISNLQR